MNRKSPTYPTPEERLKIGRDYEIGKSLRGKALLAKYGISWKLLINCAAEYRAKYPRGTA